MSKLAWKQTGVCVYVKKKKKLPTNIFPGNDKDYQ